MSCRAGRKMSVQEKEPFENKNRWTGLAVR
jgi:hypothetical protein